MCGLLNVNYFNNVVFQINNLIKDISDLNKITTFFFFFEKGDLT